MKKSKKINLILLVLISIITLILGPMNLNFQALDIGFYYYLNYLVYIVFWIIPILYMYNKNYTINHFIGLLIVNIVVFIILMYLGGQHGAHKGTLTKDKVERINSIIEGE